MLKYQVTTLLMLLHHFLTSIVCFTSINPTRSPLIFLDTFQDTVTDPGNSLSLRCIASGSPLPQVTWLLDNEAIPDSIRFRSGDYVTRDGLLVSYVNISNLGTQDGGLYQCTASNEVTTITHSSRIRVVGPPFVRPMKNVSAVSGETIQLNCPVGGHPITNVYWEKENQRIPMNHRQKVFPNGTLFVTDVERIADEGKYTCTAIGPASSTSSDTTHRPLSASSSLHLSVLIRPVIDPFVFPRSLHQGQRYTILCSVSQGDFPITIKWFKDRKLISSSSGLTPEFAGIGVIHVSPFSSNLVFDSLRPDHMGNYTCEASNSAGSVTHNGTMVIHVPPKWIIEPRDTFVLKGKTALIDCSADGFPPPSVRWSKTDGLLNNKDNKNNPSPEFKPVISNPHVRVFQNGSLAISSVARSDGASYLCQVTNGIGSGLSKVISLTVNVAAHFEGPKFRAITVRKGHEASLKCEAEGDPPLSVSWMKDKVPLNTKVETRYELIEAATNNGVMSEVIIRNSDRRDSSLFTCSAYNSFGTDDMNLQLIMQEPPDAPQEVKLLEADGRTATISWSPPFSGNSPITSYLVQHKVDTEKWSVGRGIVNSTVPGSENFITLRGLKPVTVYQVRVSALNNLGKSDFSEVSHFSTDEEAPGGPPLQIKATALSSRSVKVTWKPPRKDLQYGNIKGYYVGYRVFDLENESFVYKTLEVKHSGHGHSLIHQDYDECHLTGLKRFTKYAIIVQAFNGKGTGPSSEVIEVQTLQNDPPPPPSLKVSTVTTSSIHLTWTINGQTNDGSEGTPSPPSDPIAGFILHQKKHHGNDISHTSVTTGYAHSSSSATISSDWEEIRLPGDRTSHTFERLACGSKYQYFITAFNAVGKSDPSEILTTKTEGNAPVAPDKNSLISVNTTAAHIYLDSWHDGSCAISSFEIQHKPRKSNRSKWDSVRVFPASFQKNGISGQKAVIISDLLPSTIYDLKIVAVNEAGSTDILYAFTTASMLRAASGTGLSGLNEASGIHSNNLVNFDLSLLLPTTVSLVLVIVLIFLARVCLMKKRQLDNQLYGSSVYEPSSKAGASESVCLTGLGPNCTIKNKSINGTPNGHGNVDGNYPNPYELTKLNGDNGGGAHCNGHSMIDSMRSQTTPLKPMLIDGQEPMYATVKRTARNPRTGDCHLYQYPCTINGTTGLVTITADSCCETDSCLSLTSSANGTNGGPTSAFLRLHDGGPSDHLLPVHPYPSDHIHCIDG